MPYDKLTIRSSTVEFLIFQKQTHTDGIEVRYQDGTLWLTQKMMSELFDVSVPAINQHLKKVYADGELEDRATIKKYLIVQTKGSRRVERSVEHYNLDAVISVGYRVNSVRATQFRRWATQVLSQFAKTGYASFLSKNHRHIRNKRRL